MLIRALGHANPPLGRGERGRSRAVPGRHPSTIRSLSVLSTGYALEGASFEQAAEEPATTNGFREPRMQSADSDDPGQGFQLKAATIPIEGGQYWPVGTFMGSQRW